MQQENRIISYSEEETKALAYKVARELHLGDLLLLKGELGSGKSTFARALIQTLCGETTEVPSPTFTLVQSYEAPEFTLWHFDLYRLDHPDEIFELGIEEALRCGVCVIEWPERLGTHLPNTYREIEFHHGKQDSERIITFRREDN
ncbi:MAG: ATPase or kinase [uncultured bacterium]|nr:MAG: ATPase or kinase [uncultured bacterium]OFW69776.1 MAG: tRNA (adenosine(37)-N6)-threonylcarbamoyltransferase complex ATPase subunit type 1 TsaE [Alphaproteobacteria bacterium GWC2_42_16]OFW74375.1 MAG: tRNA (adenosine(37)-N6)-threonylcarbamoyltransferase complex ATPase subunit type 1 TsaE [Alphaproteobacteria bacterium GWA2_41_27]OFW82526.1 MAG: tRNA (adenosine(37)-N6)-threonylcarbamoyltransferase complex ATPase subunit type 1 TsaE [Alphaproteobacteria bacterium RIFCSPHIGHO2_12_FULL_42_10